MEIASKRSLRRAPRAALATALLLFSAGHPAQTLPGFPTLQQQAKPTGTEAAAGQTSNTLPTAEEIEKRIASSEAALAALSSPEENALSEQERSEAQTLLSELIGSYRYQLGRLKDLDDLLSLRAQGDGMDTEITSLPDSPPYSFVAVDQLRERERSLLLSLSTADAMSSLIGPELEWHRESLRKASIEARQLTEKAEAAGLPRQTARLRALQELAELRVRSIASRMTNLQLEQRIAEEQAQIDKRQLNRVREQLARSAGQSVFSDDELRQIKENLEAERQATEDERETARNAQVAALEELREAEEALRSIQNRGGKPAEDEETSPNPLALQRSVELRRARQENLAQSVRVLALRENSYASEGQIWEQRLALNRSPDAATVSAAKAMLSEQRRKLGPIREFLDQRIDQSNDLVSEREGLEKRALSPDESLHHSRMAELFRERVGLYRDLHQFIIGYQRLLDRLEQDIQATRNMQPLIERLQTRALAAWKVVLQIWNYEIFAVEDRIEVEGQIIVGKRSVTVGKFVEALLILAVTFWLSRLVSRRIEKMAVKRFGMDRGRSRLVRRWSDALGLILLAVIALILVKIPLTVFAFVGGAVAIGIGFGMQTLFKNLISGLMILFERPFQLGDLVSVGPNTGRITDIGLRSSVVRDMIGIETLIPNSSFLESNVTNWTYSNKRVRFSVQAPVAYGTDAGKVREILAEIGSRHGLILKNPPPFVLFDEFGADSLVFSLHFWLELSPEIDRWVIQSDLRYMINEAFSRAGIVIAFPQRDVHLDTSRPLEIQVINTDESGIAPGTERPDLEPRGGENHGAPGSHSR